MNKVIFTLLMVMSMTSITAQCYPDRHNTSAENSWVSCEMQVNPNSNRPLSHWVMYDFGDLYSLGQTHFWNLNVFNGTDFGISEAFIDYSIDGINWIEWGKFELNEAPASGYYEGEAGPNLEGLSAQFLLITVDKNHGGNCAGFSEVRIQTNGITSDVDNFELYVANLKAHPNPATNFTQVEILSKTNTAAELQLTDMTGRSLHSESLNLSEGVNKMRLETAQYSSGQYLISLKINEQIKSVNLSIINP